MRYRTSYFLPTIFNFEGNDTIEYGMGPVDWYTVENCTGVKTGPAGKFGKIEIPSNNDLSWAKTPRNHGRE